MPSWTTCPAAPARRWRRWRRLVAEVDFLVAAARPGIVVRRLDDRRAARPAGACGEGGASATGASARRKPGCADRRRSKGAGCPAPASRCCMTSGCGTGDVVFRTTGGTAAARRGWTTWQWRQSRRMTASLSACVVAGAYNGCAGQAARRTWTRSRHPAAGRKPPTAPSCCLPWTGRHARLRWHDDWRPLDVDGAVG